MNLDSLNRWLTLAANVGVLGGILLLVFELNQNSTLMRAQIFNERASQGSDIFMTVAETPELSSVVGVFFGLDYEEKKTAVESLTHEQQLQLRWFLRAERYRIENLLYQQQLGVLQFDEGAIVSGRMIIEWNEALADAGLFGETAPTFGRLRRLIAEAEGLAK